MRAADRAWAMAGPSAKTSGRPAAAASGTATAEKRTSWLADRGAALRRPCHSRVLSVAPIVRGSPISAVTMPVFCADRVWK